MCARNKKGFSCPILQTFHRMYSIDIHGFKYKDWQYIVSQTSIIFCLVTTFYVIYGIYYFSYHSNHNCRAKS